MAGGVGGLGCPRMAGALTSILNLIVKFTLGYPQALTHVLYPISETSLEYPRTIIDGLCLISAAF